MDLGDGVVRAPTFVPQRNFGLHRASCGTGARGSPTMRVFEVGLRRIVLYFADTDSD